MPGVLPAEHKDGVTYSTAPLHCYASSLTAVTEPTCPAALDDTIKQRMAGMPHQKVPGECTAGTSYWYSAQEPGRMLLKTSSPLTQGLPSAVGGSQGRLLVPGLPYPPWKCCARTLGSLKPLFPSNCRHDPHRYYISCLPYLPGLSRYAHAAVQHTAHSLACCSACYVSCSSL